MPKERDIQATIMQYLRREPGVWAVKYVPTLNSEAGVPDILCCVGGQFIALEVKQATGRVTPLQGEQMRRIASTGGIAAVVRNLDEAREIIEEVKRVHAEICEQRTRVRAGLQSGKARQ